MLYLIGGSLKQTHNYGAILAIYSESAVLSVTY